MRERDDSAGERSRTTERSADATSRTESSMRARRWVIAHRFRDPAAYGIPELPTWDVRTDDRKLAFAASSDTAPFISAERPVRVRR